MDNVTITLPREQWEAVIKATDVALYHSEKPKNNNAIHAQALRWLAGEHFSECLEKRPIQHWIMLWADRVEKDGISAHPNHELASAAMKTMDDIGKYHYNQGHEAGRNLTMVRNEVEVASKIMTTMGYAQEESREPGADRLRDRIAEIIRTTARC